jgi:hypothetical protein
VTSPLRARLTELIAVDVDRHHLVVWQDTDAEYGDVAAIMVPEGAAFARYEGSWFKLRYAIEAQLTLAEPPRLVVYVGAPAPARDPLAEVRAAAYRFEIPLRDLVRTALQKYLPREQIEEIAISARTYGEAEAVAGTGVAPGVMALVSIFGAGLTDMKMVVAILGGTRDTVLDQKDSWGDVQRLVERTLGVVTADTGEALRSTVARVLLLDAVDRAGALPARLQTALPIAWR